MQSDIDALLANQIAYYRARASEYDETGAVDPVSRGRLVAALDEFAPQGRVLEVACGTGQWTAELARHASHITALDSAPEMLELAAGRVTHPDIEFVLADVFGWSPARRYDVVFFSAWLSHVPPPLFDPFWERVGLWLTDRGRVFFIDEVLAAAAQEGSIGADSAVERRLSTGELHRAVKVFYEPAALVRRLAELGWRATSTPVGWRFFYGSAAR